MQLWLHRAAGGAELHQVAVSLDGEDVGGFALTLPILGINLFLCRHIYHLLHRDSLISCRLLKTDYLLAYPALTSARALCFKVLLGSCEGVQEATMWGVWMRSRRCAPVRSHWWGPTAVNTGRWVGWNSWLLRCDARRGGSLFPWRWFGSRNHQAATTASFLHVACVF